jgi:hypothetical protein
VRQLPRNSYVSSRAGAEACARGCMPPAPRGDGTRRLAVACTRVSLPFSPFRLSFATSPSGGQVVDPSALIRRPSPPDVSTLLHRLRLCPFLCGGRRQLALETLARRQPLTVYQRTARRPPLRRRDRLGLGWLSRVWTRIVREAPDDLNAKDQIGSGDFEPNVARKTQRATA